MRRIALWTLMLGLAAASPAGAATFMQVDAVTHRGYVSTYVLASTYLTDVQVVEVDDGVRELARPAMQFYADTAEYGPLNYAQVRDITPWKCSRRVRHLAVIGRADDGRVEQTEYTVRTPSCANRLGLRVRPGRVTVEDSFEQGGVTAAICARRCRRIVVPDGRASVSRRLRVKRGDKVVLRTRYQRLVRTVGRHETGGATVLATGDSMMQSVDAALGDRLARKAAVTSDVRPGAALASVVSIDWLKAARQQVRRLHPRATVIFLGTNDLYPIDRGDGTTIECCGAEWQAAYEKRARAAMEIYTQDGAGDVIWLTMPFARDHRRDEQVVAVNGVLARASAGIPGVHLLPIDHIFTPDGGYRRDMEYKGRRVRVRESDGFHLTPAGAAIATDYIVAALKRCGAL
jgi:lysophospholipase L1-like esterase